MAENKVNIDLQKVPTYFNYFKASRRITHKKSSCKARGRNIWSWKKGHNLKVFSHFYINQNFHNSLNRNNNIEQIIFVRKQNFDVILEKNNWNDFTSHRYYSFTLVQFRWKTFAWWRLNAQTKKNSITIEMWV